MKFFFLEVRPGSLRAPPRVQRTMVLNISELEVRSQSRGFNEIKKKSLFKSREAQKNQPGVQNRAAPHGVVQLFYFVSRKPGVSEPGQVSSLYFEC